MSQSFTYRGPAQAVSLHDAAGAVIWEGNLAPGRPVKDLPVDHPHVAAWVAGKLLEPLAAVVVEEPATTDPEIEPGKRVKRSQQEG
ncbi:MAG TPA: hypothetical protein VIQ29_04315 [Ancylobacter sp.]